MEKKTTVLMILDGFGINEKVEGNAIKQANTPVLDAIFKKYPFVKGYASGRDVGLPEGQMGNSEVGHLNIGAGRIVYQEFTRITKAIEDGDFYENPELLQAIEHCKKNSSALHLYGLVSDGGVHSHNTHLYALLRLAKKHDLQKVYVHAFLDGRDTPPSSGADYVAELAEKMREIEAGQIATVGGRYYAMDRDKRWERVQEAYDAMVLGKGTTAQDAVDAVKKSYEKGKTDEFMAPTVIVNEDGKAKGKISDHDAVISFNFRPDRAREITRAMCDPEFNGFQREKVLQDLKYVCFTEYDVTIPNKEVAFKPQRLTNTLGSYISSLGLKQLRTAETEKYAHVTFFFNGGVEEPNPNEDRWLVPSPKVATYDLQPEMSAFQVTEGLVKAIRSKEYDLIIVNFANPDMVGHTGIMEAAIKAVEVVDTCISKVMEALVETGGNMFLCADHGNSDQMVDYVTHEAFTAHTTNPVPFVLINYTDGVGLRDGGRLADIAPTLLEMMGVPIPEEMTGKSLLTGN
ncbi:2,3-bisphosphoglycerate-independent phosphoglycerate mutase [Anaerotignum sp. MB30-C6]|uniref:2,3-bisphosphoglycerate-independent phosphoglycerate mutase n=1 Tax=Anaerotignum sp. MB30-C6 TaxID=3070814 RepID=UPI0027DB2B52|nr:2,3-bisphosphoglycerate-independent phosphoglycerate mutase [Anaerotignum sp. MB30-C6]WMI81711.1 2,3-bisphosphoglycerate-independent phosphoglycerate mutase [Anaerotignum sp. MB30-C6]